jgi:hypothetical protein
MNGSGQLLAQAEAHPEAFGQHNNLHFSQGTSLFGCQLAAILGISIIPKRWPGFLKRSFRVPTLTKGNSTS